MLGLQETQPFSDSDAIKVFRKTPFCARMQPLMEEEDMLVSTCSIRRKKQQGVTTVEYAVMLVLVAIAVLGFGSGIAGSVTGVFSTLISTLK